MKSSTDKFPLRFSVAFDTGRHYAAPENAKKFHLTTEKCLKFLVLFVLYLGGNAEKLNCCNNLLNS